MNGVMGSANSSLDQLNSALEPTFRAVSWTEIGKDYHDNEIATNKKWVGQWVTITGKTAVIFDHQYSYVTQSVILQLNSNHDAAFRLKPTEESKVLKLKKASV